MSAKQSRQRSVLIGRTAPGKGDRMPEHAITISVRLIDTNVVQRFRAADTAGSARHRADCRT
jgi:hypothetical protein